MEVDLPRRWRLPLRLQVNDGSGPLPQDVLITLPHRYEGGNLWRSGNRNRSGVFSVR